MDSVPASVSLEPKGDLACFGGYWKQVKQKQSKRHNGCQETRQAFAKRPWNHGEAI